MILVWGVPGDEPIDAVCSALKRRSADFRLLDQRTAADMSTDFSIGSDGGLGGTIVYGDEEIDLDDVGAAYVRPMETRRACPEIGEDDPIFLRATAIDASLVSWADLARATMMNRPAAMASNNSKPYQLSLIAAAGFAVPDTLVTTDADAVARFYERHGCVIYKSVSGVRSIVSRLASIEPDSLQNVGNCPTQFQQYIPGSDVRVHVVGSSVIATEIVSSADDYRYAARAKARVAMAPVDLPAEFADRCRSLLRSLGLSLAGIDFRQTPDGKWYCLEANPSPGFTYFEAATGQPIAAAVADLLISADIAPVASARPAGGLPSLAARPEQVSMPAHSC